MGIDLRRPMITSPTAEGQLLQIKSYLFQLVDQLQFALNNLTSADPAASTESQKSTEKAAADPDIEVRLNNLKSLIVGGSVVDTLLLGKRLTASETAPVSLDGIRTPGCYYATEEDSEYIQNTSGAEGGFRLEVKQLQDENNISQTAYYGGAWATRCFDGSTWSEWRCFMVSTEFSSPCTDVVIENGASGGWTYRKWKGGTYEMYGIFEVTPASSELNGTLYRTNDIEVPTPFAITDDAVVTGTGAENYLLTNGIYANDNAISIRLMCDKEIGTADPITARLRVNGTYAQTED